jgi:hypothetical protein
MLRLVNLLYEFFLFLDCNIGSTVILRVIVDDFHTLDLAWLPCVAVEDGLMEVFIARMFFPKRYSAFCPWM